MRAQEFIIELKIDNTQGLGAVPWNNNVDYQGLRVLMKPSTFLRLSLPLNLTANDHSTIDYIANELNTQGIGAPFLQIEIPEAWEKEQYVNMARVVGHDGRHRMLAIQAKEGDKPVEVHLFPRYYRHRDFVQHPEWVEYMDNALISQTGTPVNGPLFTVIK